MTGDDSSDDGPSAARVREALSGVEDPDLGMSVLDSGLVTDVTENEGLVTIGVDLAGIDADTAEEVTGALRRAALSRSGVEDVRIDGETPEHDDRESDDVDCDRPAEAVIAVASAKGGVGKTTVATQLARALAADADRVGLFDADLYGPNVPDLLDLEGPVRTTDDGAAEPVETGGIAAMSVGLIAEDAPLAWRGAMAHEALTDLFGDTAWGAPEYLVIDLPPGTGDVVLTALEALPIDGVVLVTTPYPTSLADTARSAALFDEEGVPVLGTVVNMRGFTCECGREHDLFPEGDPADALDHPVLAELPFDGALRDVDGPVPAAATDLAGAVTDRLEDRPALEIPDHALDLRGLPRRIRREHAREEFRALDPGETLYVVDDRDPEPLAAALAAAVDRKGPPTDAFDRYERRRRGPDEWVLALSRPADPPDART